MLYNMQTLGAEKLLVGSFYTTIFLLCCSQNNEVVFQLCYLDTVTVAAADQSVEHQPHHCTVGFRAFFPLF